jgi:mycofactocin precursor
MVVTQVTDPSTGEHSMPETQSVEETTPAPEPLVEEDLLVEDVSIDGMCGVY